MTLRELITRREIGPYGGRSIELGDTIVVVDNASGDEYEYQVYYSETLDRWELLIDTTPTEPFDHKAKGKG